MNERLFYVRSDFFSSFFYNCFFSLITILFLSNCNPKTVPSNPPLEIPEKFSASGAAPLMDEWWLNFNDPQLDTLVATALDSNFSLRVAWQRYETALAIVDRETSNLLPDVEGNVQSAISRPEPDFVGGENVQLGLRATYEVDLWGRIRASIEAERFRAEASENDFKAAAIALSGEITTVWYRLQAENFQLRQVEAQIETNEKILRLLNARFGSGQIRGVDILRQKQLIASTREQKAFVEARIGLLQHQLAVLLGNPPDQNIYQTNDSLPELPPLPDTGIPMDLIERRPDVQMAYNNLEAADREVAAAISNQYPRLTLRTNGSLRSNNFQDILQGWAYSLAGNLLVPIFYGGRLSAEVDRTEAVKNQRLHQYAQSVLIAFREVEDAIIQENRQKETISAISEQVELASQSAEQLKMQYFNGMSNYLDVLTALDQEQQLRRNLITARLNLLEYRIALYRALAGGFEVTMQQQE